MKIIHIIILCLIAYNCSNENIKRISINVGESTKIHSKQYYNTPENYIFYWSPPLGPENHKSTYIIKNDYMIFKAAQEGYYTIKLTIQDDNLTTIDEEIFYFNAIVDSFNQNIIVDAKKNPIEKEIQTQRQKKTINAIKESKVNNKKNISTNKKTELRYTIQVSAWQEINKALIDKKLLQKMGFNAYTEKLKKNNSVWHRVRVGNFKNKQDAENLKNKLLEFMPGDIWIDKFYID